MDKNDKKSEVVDMDTKTISIGGKNISISGLAMGVLAIVAGILVLVLPDLLRWIIGSFFIVWGILAIVNYKK